MPDKTPSDFTSHEDWLSYVATSVPAHRQAYVLACGRTDLFRDYYRFRNRTIPVELEYELCGVHALSESERTSRLEEVNKRIFADMTSLLFGDVKARQVDPNGSACLLPVGQIDELLSHLLRRNRYFAEWIAYKRGRGIDYASANWPKDVAGLLGSDREDDIAFAVAMAELDKLLLHFRDRNAALPRYFFEHCRFLHALHGPERMLQTRALLNTLTAEIGACASV